MKRVEFIVSLMILSLLLTFAGCSKKIVMIDEDNIIDALENVLDLEEFDGEHRTDCYFIENVGPDNFGVSAYVNNDTEDPNDECIYIEYYSIDDEDSVEEWFESQENTFGRNNENLVAKSYTEGECGYFIVQVDNTIKAFYFADGMRIEVDVISNSGYDLTEEFLKELGLPFKHR